MSCCIRAALTKCFTLLNNWNVLLKVPADGKFKIKRVTDVVSDENLFLIFGVCDVCAFWGRGGMCGVVYVMCVCVCMWYMCVCGKCLYVCVCGMCMCGIVYVICVHVCVCGMCLYV